MSFAINIERLYYKLGYDSKVLYHCDEDSEIYFKIALPKRCGILPELEDIEGLEKITYDDLFDYFEELKDLDIRYLNGISTKIMMTHIGQCYYCDKDIGSRRYYSFNRFVDVCYECYDEKKDEDDWVEMYDTFEIKCSMCQKMIKENILLPFKIASNCLDYYNCYNMCQECMKSEKGVETIKEKNLRVIDYKIKNDQNRFGSLLDWAPIYKSVHDDRVYNMFVLYNINIESVDYGKLGCCVMDNEGRMGYYQFPEPYNKLGDVFVNLVQKQLIRYYKIKDKFGEDSLENYYSGPLQLAMSELGMKIYFE